MNMRYCIPQNRNLDGEHVASPVDSGVPSFTQSQLAIQLPRSCKESRLDPVAGAADFA